MRLLYPVALVCVALTICTAFVACMEVEQIADTNVMYKRDVKIVHMGKEYSGVAVLPMADKYVLDLTFQGEVDLFTLRSCHREVTQEEAGGGAIFGKKNRVSYTYQPIAPLESEKFCPVEIIGLEKEKGRNSWAFIDFETEREKMPSVVTCNGKVRQYNGVSICQSLTGLMQRIKFARPTKMQSIDGCPNPWSVDNGVTYDIIVGNGRCVYSFAAVEAPRDLHRLSTIGYSEILIRGGN